MIKLLNHNRKTPLSTQSQRPQQKQLQKNCRTTTKQHKHYNHRTKTSPAFPMNWFLSRFFSVSSFVIRERLLRGWPVNWARKVIEWRCWVGSWRSNSAPPLSTDSEPETKRSSLRPTFLREGSTSRRCDAIDTSASVRVRRMRSCAVRVLLSNSRVYPVLLVYYPHVTKLTLALAIYGDLTYDKRPHPQYTVPWLFTTAYIYWRLVIPNIKSLSGTVWSGRRGLKKLFRL